MPTLQKTINYQGDLKKTPLENLELEFKIPVCEYFNLHPEDGGTVLKKIVGTETITVSQAIVSKVYRLAFGEEFAIGKSEDSFTAFQAYYLQSFQKKRLENLFIEVGVQYLADANYKVGEESLNLIYFPKLAIDTSKFDKRSSSAPFQKLFIAVNRDAYFNLLYQLKTAMIPIEEFFLMELISYLTDLTQIEPTLLNEISQETEQWLSEKMSEYSIKEPTKVLGLIEKVFDSLYDFPLAIPEIKTLEIKGKFTIVAPDETKISIQEFLSYRLSATYSFSGNGEVQTLRYTFGDNISVQNNSVQFSFTDDRKLFQSTDMNPILVEVTASNGSVPWSKRYKPGDPQLKSIEIEVPFQPAITLKPVDKDTATDDTKKLRGQVLEFSKKCPLGDLTVLVQAKSKGDKVWKIIASATTDSMGNFSMPYPYGNFIEAQTLVSLKPDDPAPISINEGGDENQKIAEDFLYLLLRDIECAPAESEKDCDCDGQKKPLRLPDYVDLIESDDYTQDIGGSCVNLSKPNRTLSEFNYQAIVRTSDPEIANYTLKKIETGVDAVDISLGVALKSASSALVSVTNEFRNYDKNLNALVAKLVEAMNAAWPHVNAIDIALNARESSQNVAVDPLFDTINYPASPGNYLPKATMKSVKSLAYSTELPAVSISVIGTALTHLTAAIAIVKAIPEDFSLGNEPKFLNPANDLKDLLNVAIDSVGAAARYELVGGAAKRERKPIDLNNPVAWQDAPDDKKNESVYQAVQIATGHILHYKALFKADGYSLGDLIYSLPLAPGQKKEIVVFDSSHTLQGAESQFLYQGERLTAGITSERDIISQLGGRINESITGSSSANTSGISAGFGTGGQGYGGTGAYGGSGSAVLGVAGGVANSNSTASQNSSRDVSQFFGEKLRQSIMQNADGYRQLNASVVTTVQEGQRYGITSEVVANHNHCHALTVMYFEVLRHYAIFQELSSVEECVFVPLLLTNFSIENISRWRDVLAPSLLPMPSETYLQPFSFVPRSGREHPLLKAFDANERIKSLYANVDFPQGAYDDEPIRFVKGDMLLRVELPRPKTRYDRIKSLPITTKTTTTQEIDPIATAKQAVHDSIAAGLTGGLSLLFTGPPGTNIQYNTSETQVQVKQAIFDAFMTLDANFQSVPPSQCIRVTNFDPKSISFGGITVPISGLDFFLDGIVDKDLWTAYATLLDYSDGDRPRVIKMLDYYFKGRLISEWDDIFYNEIVPVIFNKIVASLKITEISADFTSETKYRGGERLIRLYLNGTTSKKRSQLPQQLKMLTTSQSVKALKDSVLLNIENMRITYSTSHYNGLLFSGNINDDLLDDTTVFIPENSEEKRNPRREDRYLAAKLIGHLNSHLEYYNKALWYSLDPDRRFMLLDGFNIQVFDDFGNLSGSRSLASVVKNDLITATGNSLVFPVAPGYKVSNSYIMEKNTKAAEQVTLFDHYKPITPIEPYRISVPSKGVFAEAVQGACNACEKIETDRLQDWNRFPNVDEPTTILPITTPTPGVTDWKAAFKDFATPIVNIQNAPGAPSPGAGLSGLSELLGKSGVFKDITGLDANQQNVLKTYLSNQENTKAFAEMAKEMAMQSHNTQNADKIMDSLKSAKDTGALNQEDYGKLVKDHLQQQIDGGETKKAELDAVNQATTNDERKAVTKAIGKIPGENLESVETETTKVTARPGSIIPVVGTDRNISMPMGVDVSHHQGNINWEKVVASSNVYFAMIKASDGQTIDNKFQINWKNAQGAGLACGAYHFWLPQVTGKKQAETLIRQIGFLQKGDLPPVLDIEDASHAKFTGLTTSNLENNIQEFLDTVQTKFGIAPIIYTNPGFWKEKMKNSTKFSNYLLWIANYSPKDEPTLPGGWPTWEFWQLTDSGRVDGISGVVDLNIFNGDLEALWLMARKNSKTIDI